MGVSTHFRGEILKEDRLKIAPLATFSRDF
jgi:hypothetical protein